jgi:transposase
MAKVPEVTVMTEAEIEDLIGQLRALLPPGTYEVVERLLRTMLWLMSVLREKNASITRLRRALFGNKTEKTDKILDPTPGTSSKDNSASHPQGKDQPKRKGHGRKGAKDYPGAKRISVPHPKFKAGELCPKCLKGKLYLLKIPARIISIVARPIFGATIYELEKLRCALCGAVLTAPAPPEAMHGKYHPSVGVMLPIVRYGIGVPMYRIEKWQNCFGVPLPASTQWEIIEAASKTPELVYEALIDAAAGGSLVHNDDTTMRVQSLLKEIALETGEGKKRTGIFTTGIVSQIGAHRAALFFTGRNHAGENLDALLKRRSVDLEKPLQMCDALKCNLSKEAATELCHCILHGRRNFVDVIESFPEDCRKVIEDLREIYRVDALAKERNLSAEQRLSLHQEQSGPVMDELHRWMKERIDQKKVEPNSGLGKAMAYMLKHWEPLTRFLHIPGAPLDNNICERALKTAILHRKNSLSYKTIRGARVGDIFMSLIHTCQLNGVNPFEYLMALQNNAAAVGKDPPAWLPWNYPRDLQRLETT